MHSRWNLITVCLAVGAFGGCRDAEGVSRYTAPKTSKISPPPKIRLLAAIFPRADDTWFFKLTGPVAAVDQTALDLERFVHSVRFTGKADPPIEWTLPADWRKGTESPTRYATFHAGSGSDAPELSVTKLGKNAGSVLANVNRWRDQMGLHQIAGFELDAVTKKITVNGVDATWVDMTSPGK
jgi:hypothetical protein